MPRAMVVVVCGLTQNRLLSRFFPWSSQYHPALQEDIFYETHLPQTRSLHHLAAELSALPNQWTVLDFQYLPHLPATHHAHLAKPHLAKCHF